MELLTDILSDGALPSVEVFQIASEHGISVRTINRAKVQLGMKSIKDGASWKMCLPESIGKNAKRHS